MAPPKSNVDGKGKGKAVVPTSTRVTRSMDRKTRSDTRRSGSNSKLVQLESPEKKKRKTKAKAGGAKKKRKTEEQEEEEEEVVVKVEEEEESAEEDDDAAEEEEDDSEKKKIVIEHCVIEEQKDPAHEDAKIDKVRGKRPSKFIWDNENTPVPSDFPAGKSVKNCIENSMKERGFTGPIDMEIVVGYTDTVVKRVGKEIPIIYASETKRPSGSANNQIADTKIKRRVNQWLKEPHLPQNVVIMSADTGFKETFDRLVEAGHCVVLISPEQENQSNSVDLKKRASFSYNLRTIFGLPKTPPETRKKKKRKALKKKKKALKKKKKEAQAI